MSIEVVTILSLFGYCFLSYLFVAMLLEIEGKDLHKSKGDTEAYKILAPLTFPILLGEVIGVIWKRENGAERTRK